MKAYESPVRSDDILHFGVKGMKWYQHIFGDDNVRNVNRYVRSDGSRRFFGRRKLKKLTKKNNKRVDKWKDKYKSALKSYDSAYDKWDKLTSDRTSKRKAIKKAASRIRKYENLILKYDYKAELARQKGQKKYDALIAKWDKQIEKYNSSIY